MSQGKLTDVVEEVPVDKGARHKARKLSLCAGDDTYAGAKGTKGAPGRSFPLRPIYVAPAPMPPAYLAPTPVNSRASCELAN